MNVVREYFLKMADKYDARSFRERILLFMTLLVFVYFIWKGVVYGYFLVTEDEVSQNAETMKSKLSLLQGQIDAISQALGRDPTSLLIKKEKDLRTQNVDLQDKIEEHTKRMVSSKEMIQILRDMTERTIGLKVISLESTDSKPLFPEKQGFGNIKVFLHGIRLEMQGEYFDTLRFLETIEQQRFRMLWDKLTYEVQQYPVAKIVIYIYTLGLEEGWIGV